METKGNRSSRPHPRSNGDATFGTLLSRYLDIGMRPFGVKDIASPRWHNKAFAEAAGVTSRTVRNWRNDLVRPADLETIERLLFGSDPELQTARLALRTTFARPPSQRPARRPSEAQVGAPSTRIPPPARCFGRTDEVERIVHCLLAERGSCTIILGSPGIGKTTTSRAVANDPEIVERFRHRRWFASLSAARDVAGFELAISQCMGLPSNTTFSQMVAQMRRAKAVLILDNLETPWERDVERVEARLSQLAQVPKLHVVATMRGRSAPASVLWDGGQVELGPLSAASSEELFRSIAPRTSANDATMAEVVRDLGGVPLAIELLALRAQPHETLEEVAAEWRRRRTNYLENPDGAPSPKSSLNRSLEMSFSSPRLKTEGRRLLARLAFSPAGLHGDDRQSVLGHDAAEGSRQLLGLGLAHQTDGRMDMLPPIRDYALNWAKLDPGAERDVAHHFASLCRDLGAHVGRENGSASLRRLISELANIESAVGYLIRTSDTPVLTSFLRRYADVIGNGGAGSLDPLIQVERYASDHKITELVVLVQLQLGRVLRWRSDFTGASERFSAALMQLGENSDHLLAAELRMRLSDILIWRSEYVEADRLLDSASLISAKHGEALITAHCLYYKAEILRRTSDYTLASRTYWKAIRIYRILDEQRSRGDCHYRLAYIYRCRGRDMAESRSWALAKRLYVESGAPLGLANIQYHRAVLEIERGNQIEAREILKAAKSAYTALGSTTGLTNIHLGEGALALASGDTEEAEAQFRRALHLAKTTGDRGAQGESLSGLGAVMLQRGDYEDGIAMLKAALSIFEDIQNSYNLGLVRSQIVGAARVGPVSA